MNFRPCPNATTEPSINLNVYWSPSREPSEDAGSVRKLLIAEPVSAIPIDSTDTIAPDLSMIALKPGMMFLAKSPTPWARLSRNGAAFANALPRSRLLKSRPRMSRASMVGLTNAVDDADPKKSAEISAPNFWAAERTSGFFDADAIPP